MKILKRIIYSLLGVLLAGVISLVGLILYAEYSGRHLSLDPEILAKTGLTDEPSRLVYDENDNPADFPVDASAETAPATANTAAANVNAETTVADTTDSGTASGVAPDTETDAAADVERTYVMDMGSNLFHIDSCPYAANIAAENRSTMTTTKEKILTAGYEPCTNCNP